MSDSTKTPEQLGREWAENRNSPIKTTDEMIASHGWHPHGPEANQFAYGAKVKLNDLQSRLFETDETKGRLIDKLGDLNLEVRGADGSLKYQPLSEVFSYHDLGEIVDTILKSIPH